MLHFIDSSASRVSKPTHYIFLADVSGSMSGTLGQLRAQLKNKLTTLINVGDKLTIIYFSGSDTAGYVFEDAEINSIGDLTTIKSGIDKWLHPIGLTAFCKPLKLALDKVDPNYLNGMVFMTDGYNNDCQPSAIFSSLAQVKEKFDSVTFIEYGYYADSALIAKMADATNGSAVLSTDFQNLSLTIESGFKSLNAPKIPVEITGDFAVGFGGDILTLYRPEGNTIYVNGNTQWVFYGTPTSIAESISYVWGKFALGDIDAAEQELYSFGDIGLIDAFGKAYGKQKLADFRQMLLDTLTGVRNPYAEGNQSGYRPDDNAYTVMDLLRDLSNGDNYIYPRHDKFNYNRVGRKAIEKTTVDALLLENVTEVTGSASVAKELLNVQTFKPSHENPAASIGGLQWNTSRSNVNLSVTTDGTVVNLPENKWGLTEYQSKTIRSYNVIKDGISNLTQIPVSLDANTLQILTEKRVDMTLLPDVAGRTVYLLNFEKLPVINRGSLKRLSAVETAEQFFELEQQKAAAKVFKYFTKSEAEPADEAEELTEWLGSVGIKSYGYSPLTTLAESVDFYMAPQLDVKIKGLSSLPAVAATIKKREDGKSLTLADTLILKYVDLYVDVETATGGDVVALKALSDKSVARKRELEVGIANTVMSLILGKRWFTDKTDYDDNVVTLNDAEFGEVTVTFAYEDVPVKI